MIYDPETSEFVNVPGVLAQLGLTDVASTLTALTDRVSALETLVDQLQAQVDTLPTGGTGGGAVSPLILGEDGQLYELALPSVDGGVTLDWRPVTAPTEIPILGGDGITYNLSIPLVEGVPTLDWNPA